ncbi:MAG: DUF5069 domain-containing protein [Prosthecobacter sp.]|uniref:DUF5069 domain-containing protein n=1 Tax=Prosthecobacter sp. TaxID=1965333 RepID=UPI0039022B26
MNAPNLTQRPPRSPRVRLGGYTILPRLLDKARAVIAGTAGEYKYNNPNDGHFFRFTGITPDALLAQVNTGSGDWDMLLWVNEYAPLKHTTLEIEQWSNWTETVAFHDLEMREWFTDQIKRLNPAREDLRGTFDYLDLDDYVSFGGIA